MSSETNVQICPSPTVVWGRSEKRSDFLPSVLILHIEKMIGPYQLLPTTTFFECSESATGQIVFVHGHTQSRLDQSLVLGLLLD